MPVSSVWFRVEAERVVDGLQQAIEKLNGAGSEMVLDFTSVRRIDASALRALESLAGMADDKAVKIALHGVNVDVYKALKLMKVAPRFAYEF